MEIKSTGLDMNRRAPARARVRYAAALLLSALFGLSVQSGASAAVVTPSLVVNNLGSQGDMGFTNVAGNLSLDATAHMVSFSVGNTLDIPDVDLSLTAIYSQSLAPTFHVFSNGSLNVGSLLTATFQNLYIAEHGGGVASFSADLTYQGGSMKGPLTGGRIEGIFSSALPLTGFASDFTATTISATVGAVAIAAPGNTVVPLPPSAWLMFSAMVATLVVGRRRQNGDGLSS
jgi:hypothetical protein